jgi:hypothetical protein
MFEFRLSALRGAIAATVVAVAATLQPLQPVTAAPAGFGSGVQLVGTDVQPGTYRSLNPGRSCYWERLSGVGGTFGEILANDNVTGPAIVTIAPGDFAFSSSRCGEWSADMTPITASPTAPFGDGDFLVGSEVSPGIWRSTGGSTCYWERRSAFSGDFNDIIANDNQGPSGTVSIAPTDVGFSSSRCGTWTKIG